MFKRSARDIPSVVVPEPAAPNMCIFLLFAIDRFVQQVSGFFLYHCCLLIIQQSMLENCYLRSGRCKIPDKMKWNIINIIARVVFILCIPVLLLTAVTAIAFNSVSLYEYGFDTYD